MSIKDMAMNELVVKTSKKIKLVPSLVYFAALMSAFMFIAGKVQFKKQLQQKIILQQESEVLNKTWDAQIVEFIQLTKSEHIKSVKPHFTELS